MTTLTGKPWEKYAAPATPSAPAATGGKPWEKYAKTAPDPGKTREEIMAIMRERSAAAGGMAGAEARAAEMDAQALSAKRDSMGFSHKLYDNVIGSDDGVQSYGEALGTWLNRAGESMTLGLVGDEASAAAYSALPGRTYNNELNRFRQNEKNMSVGGRLSADVVGAVLPAFLGVGAVARAPTLARRIGTGAALGSSYGAIQGFMEGEEGAAERAKSAAVGGVVGGAMGAAIPVLSEIGRAAWRSIKSTTRAARIAREIGGSLNVAPETATVISNIVGADDLAAMRANIGRAGPNAMLADASPALGMTLDASMRSPVAGARAAFERVEGRAGQAYDNLMGALNPSGEVRAVRQAMDDVRRGSTAALRSAYDAAYSQPIDYSSAAGGELLGGISMRLPQRAINYANELMRLRGERSAQIMASIAEDGTVTFTRPPDVRQWDYIKQALQQLAESGDGAGALGGQTRLGAAYQNLAADIRDAVAEAVPAYRTALEVASDAISERNAVRFGADLLRDNVTTYDATQTIRRSTEAELDAMRIGLIGQIEEIVGNVRAVPSDQNIDARQAIAAFKALTSSNAERKMGALFGDQWGAIRAEIERAGAALGLRARTAANSATAGRMLADRAITESVTPGPLRSGRPIEAARDFIGGITGASPDAISRLRDDVKGEIADLLTRQDGRAGQSLEMILNSLARNPINQNVGSGVSNALTGIGFGSVPMATDRVRNQLLPR
jgi:hypothetical protein